MESNMHNDEARRHERDADETHRAGERDRPRLVHLKEASDLDVADGDRTFAAGTCEHLMARRSERSRISWWTRV